MPEITIEATKLGKEYHYQAVFHQLSHRFDGEQAIAVLGDNGSGKSTLLQVLSGMTEATQGNVKWFLEGKKLPDFRWYEFLSFCSPHFNFDSRFTVEEILKQYQNVKRFQKDLTCDDLIEMMNFQSHRFKLMNELSSGMNQRVRLVLTICADVPVLFLDEPCSNLDQKGVEWYHELISNYAAGKLIFVASNDSRETRFCTDQLSLMDYK